MKKPVPKRAIKKSRKKVNWDAYSGVAVKSREEKDAAIWKAIGLLNECMKMRTTRIAELELAVKLNVDCLLADADVPKDSM